MMKRMWVSQPSTLQMDHDIHNENVLVDVDSAMGDSVLVYFTRGVVISRFVPKVILVEGWRA